MREMSSTDASRGKLREALGFARYAGERTRITMRGEAVAVLVPLQDLETLERCANVSPPPRADTSPQEEA